MLLIDQKIIPEQDRMGMAEHLQEMERKADLIVNLAKEQELKMKTQYKVQYDGKAGNESFKVGDRCWVYTPGTAQKLGCKKLASCWTGPFRVVKLCGPVNVEVKRCIDGKTISASVHINRLKPYLARTVRPPPPKLEVSPMLNVGSDLEVSEVDPRDVVDQVSEPIEEDVDLSSSEIETTVPENNKDPTKEDSLVQCTHCCSNMEPQCRNKNLTFFC